MRRLTTRPVAPFLVLAFAGWLAPAGAASASAPVPPASGPVIRAAVPPSELDRARVARWRDAWREEAGALERGFEAAIRAVEAGDDDGLRPRCVALAGALLRLERPRVLPVPDRAADLHVRRALQHLTRAAVTCLTKRPYAARHALEQAADAFAQAEGILRRYRSDGPGPTDPEASP